MSVLQAETLRPAQLLRLRSALCNSERPKPSLTLKVFSDDASGAMWKKNVKDIEGEVLCVSQFTLFANTSKGKPDFHRAMVCIVSIFVLCPLPLC